MSVSPITPARIISFGLFEVDLRSGELRKQGRRVPIQEKPFQLLALLLEHPGQVVTREELRNKLWPPDVFVDFDHSLNSAIAKLREALGDSGESPLFVETVARRGYRFIAPVIGQRPEAFAPAPSARAPIPHATIPKLTSPNGSFKRWPLVIGATAIAAVLLAASVGGPRGRALGKPQLEPLAQITTSGRVKAPCAYNVDDASLPYFASDGSRVYFTEYRPDEPSRLMAATASGMHPVSLPSHFNDPRVLDVSRDGSMLLIRDVDLTPDGRMWIVGVLDGEERPLSLLGHDARWSPDGKSMVIASGTDLSIAEADRKSTRLNSSH